MRNLTIALAAALLLVSGAFAAEQLTDITVTGGYHATPFFIFEGSVAYAGPAPTAKTTVFVANFSTRVTPEGNWAIAVSKKAIIAPDRDPEHIFITFRAVQDGTNVVVKKVYKLADLMRLVKQRESFDEIHR